MKKIRTILTILPLLFSFSLVSCQRTDSSMSSSSLSYYEEVELEGLSSEQVKEMNHIFEESEFYPNGMEVDLRKTTQEDLYFGIYNDYVIRHYRYMNANKKYSFTPRLAYSLKEKKFYSVNDLYEKGIFSDDDMAAVAPLGYVKQVHKQEERVTYEVYVSKNTQECETNRMNVYVDGNTFAWYTSSIKDQPRINGEFLSISRCENRINLGKICENFNHKKTCSTINEDINPIGLAHSYLVQNKLEAKTSVMIEYYGFNNEGSFVSTWATNEEVSQEKYEETVDEYTFINEEGRPLYLWTITFLQWWI